MSNVTNCPFWEQQEKKRSEYKQLKAECQAQIEEDMRALRLDPTKFRALVRAAAAALADAELKEEEAAITPLTYTAISREGHESPQAHPIHALAVAASNRAAALLKQLGLYVSTEKVGANIKDKPDPDDTPSDGIASLYDTLGGAPK